MVEYREPHALRICLLIATAAVIQAWTLRHHEARLPDALRSIQQAEQIAQGDWRSGVMQGLDHPLHPLGIVAARQIVGGEGPIAWQRAALAVAFGCVILWVVPLYLLAWEATDSKAAWLGCLMMAANPLVGQLVVNGLSETTFLLFWTSGLWAALRFLREGRLRWLSATLGLSVLGYLARPEGLLLPLSLILVLLILPLHRSTRILWPRWRRAVAALALGSLALAGPFMAIKGGPGTRPAVARVLGLAPSVPPDAPEREQPAETGRTPLQIHRDSLSRVVAAVTGVVTPALLPFALLGVLQGGFGDPAQSRRLLFQAILLLAAGVGLVRLHATGGYCTTRHGLIPGMILVLQSAGGIHQLMRRISIRGTWLGMATERLVPGTAVWGMIVVLVLGLPRLVETSIRVPGPFSAYRDAAIWINQSLPPDEPLLDLTGWALYLSGRDGYGFSEIGQALADPQTRWILARGAHLEGDWSDCRTLRRILEHRRPVAAFPPAPAPGRVQLLLFDRGGPSSEIPSPVRSEGPLITIR